MSGHFLGTLEIHVQLSISRFGFSVVWLCHLLIQVLSAVVASGFGLRGSCNPSVYPFYACLLGLPELLGTVHTNNAPQAAPEADVGVVVVASSWSCLDEFQARFGDLIYSQTLGLPQGPCQGSPA